VEQTEEMDGTTPWRADENGQSCYIWLKKTPKKHQKKKKKKKKQENNMYKRRGRLGRRRG
jgi:hypothetical protein